VDPRNAGRQKYCSKSACRKESKAASQRKWNLKPENQVYVQRAKSIQRVQAWRATNPGYWRRGGRGKSRSKLALQETCAAETVDNEGVAQNLRQVALQETCIAQAVGNEGVAHNLQRVALQDACLAQNPFFVGLVAFSSGLTVQEDINALLHRVLSRGQDILRMSSTRTPAANHEKEDPPVPGMASARAWPVPQDKSEPPPYRNHAIEGAIYQVAGRVCGHPTS
jgi:hypothetical protein